MKIGHFVSFGLGGADKNALNIVTALKDLGVEVVVFYNDFSMPRVMPAHSAGYQPISRFEQFSRITTTVKISSYLDIQTHNIDILHTHRSGEDTWLIPGFDTAKHPFKVLETNFHGNHSTYADVRAYPCKTLMDFKRIKEDNRNIVIANAIGMPATNANMREELKIANKIVFGRLARPDSDIFSPINLQAYSRVESDDTVFVYVAPHDLAKAEAKNLGIKNIIWVDPQLDPIKISSLYNTFDVFLHSNCVGETFGNTIAEAMMHKLPVVSHMGNHGWPQAHKEFFKNYPELIINDLNVDQYTKQVFRLKSDAAERQQIGINNHNNMLDSCSSQKIAEKYITAYKNILEKK